MYGRLLVGRSVLYAIVLNPNAFQPLPPQANSLRYIF
jgi:hypothetical protein